MKEIQPEDVLRFLNGEIEDLKEWKRIDEAIETDPKVAGWAKMLDFEAFLPPEEPDTSQVPAWLTERTRQLGRSTLWSLQTDRPPAALLQGEEVVSGCLVRSESSSGEDPSSPPVEDSLRCELHRTQADPPTFELVVEHWPQQWEPLGMILGQFEFPEYEPAAIARCTLNKLKKVIRTRASGKPDRRETPTPATMAFDQQPKGSFQFSSNDIEAVLSRDERLLEVAARVSEDRPREMLVADVRYRRNGDGEGRARRSISLESRRESDGWMIGKTALPLPEDAVSPDVEITVRPLREDDLHLLDSDQVTQFLAEQEFDSMPATASERGFSFSARWDSQQELARDETTCWCLQVASAGKEG